MNGRLRLLIAIVLIFSLVSFALPQSPGGPAKLAELEQKIKELKEMPKSDMAPSTLEVHKHMLARLYESILPLVEQQLDILTKISAADLTDKEASQVRQNRADQRLEILKALDELKPSLGLARST